MGTANGTSGLTPTIAPWINSGASFAAGAGTTTFSGSIAITGSAGSNVATASSTFTQTVQASSYALGPITSIGATMLRIALTPGPKTSGVQSLAPRGAQAVASQGEVPGAGKTNQAIGTSTVQEVLGPASPGDGPRQAEAKNLVFCGKKGAPVITGLAERQFQQITGAPGASSSTGGWR